MPTLLLLDGHSLAYRAFYALPAGNFSTSTGQHTNAVYGFTSMLINMLRDVAPTHVAVAFDKSRQTFRTEQYAEYKAGRSATPTEFSGQIPLIHEVLTALRIPFVEMEGFEADDIIATLTTRAEEADVDVVIVSGDRDAFQLVTDRVSLLYPVRGVSEVARMDPAAVEHVVAVGRSWGGAIDQLDWGKGDVLVLGSSMSSSLMARVFLGSSATKIIANSPVPVIVVP